MFRISIFLYLIEVFEWLIEELFLSYICIIRIYDINPSQKKP